MTRPVAPDPAPAPASGRVSPTNGSGDADTPPGPSRGRTGARTTPAAIEPPLPGQTELPLAYRQVTLWSL